MLEDKSEMAGFRKGHVDNMKNWAGSENCMFSKEEIVEGSEVQGLVTVEDRIVKEIDFPVEPDIVRDLIQSLVSKSEKERFETLDKEIDLSNTLEKILDSRKPIVTPGRKGTGAALNS